MKLTLFERLLLLRVIAGVEGDITTLRIVRDLKSTLAPSEDEHKEFEISKNDNGGIKWNKKGAVESPIDIGDKAREICRDELTKLNEAKKLKGDHLSLCEKFGVE